MTAINWNPKSRQLKQFGWIGCAVLLAVATWRFTGHGWSAATAVLLGAGGLLGVLAAAQPQKLRFVYVGLMVATYPIGWVVSQVLLALIFYGVFTPVGLAFRLIGRDALERRFEPESPSYWRAKRRTTDMRQYLRQF